MPKLSSTTLKCLARILVVVLGSTTNVSCASLSDGNSGTNRVVRRLASRDSASATLAAKELFSLGEAALPTLMQVRGDDRPYWGNALGAAHAAQFMVRPTRAKVQHPGVVSVEEIALYLICAIYEGRLDFAQSVYLNDSSAPESVQASWSHSLWIESAWEATDDWYTQVLRQSLDALRKQRRGPLSVGTVHFR